MAGATMTTPKSIGPEDTTPAMPPGAGYIFGPASLDNLRGVHPKLVVIVSRALLYSPIDFAVAEGLRDMERQETLVLAGTSRTLHSKHLPQSDGLGHAIDLHAIVGNVVSWDVAHYCEIHRAMTRAALELSLATELRWGGAFKNFFDGPHFELV